MSLIKDIVESYRELFVDGQDINPDDAALLRTALMAIKKHDAMADDSVLPGIGIIFQGNADAAKTRQALKSLLRQIAFPQDRNSTAVADARLLSIIKQSNFKDFSFIADEILKSCKEYEQQQKQQQKHENSNH